MSLPTTNLWASLPLLQHSCVSSVILQNSIVDFHIPLTCTLIKIRKPKSDHYQIWSNNVTSTHYYPLIIFDHLNDCNTLFIKFPLQNVILNFHTTLDLHFNQDSKNSKPTWPTTKMASHQLVWVAMTVASLNIFAIIATLIKSCLTKPFILDLNIPLACTLINFPKTQIQHGWYPKWPPSHQLVWITMWQLLV